MKYNSHPPQQALISRVDRLEDAIRQIYGNSAESYELQEICQTARQDIDDIYSGRGVQDHVIAIIGHKDAGKSTVCKFLVKDPHKRRSIAAGIGKKYATVKIQWVGPSRPDQLERDHETAHHVSADDMVELGKPYVLVDIPGYSDADKHARTAATRALRMAGAAVLVTSFDRLEDESCLEYLTLCDGAHIIPVVVTDYYNDRVDHADIRPDLRNFQNRIKRWCPQSKIEDSVIIPKIDNSPELESEAVQKIVSALTKLLETPRCSASRRGTTRYLKLQDDIKRKLSPLLDRVKPRYLELVEKERGVTEDVIKQLSGNKKQLIAGIRIRMLTSMVRDCAPGYFPFRSFLSLLALTAGAWDRLFLGFCGSVPSLAMTLVQSGKNALRLNENKSKEEQDIKDRATALATVSLSQANTIFLRSIRENLPPRAQARFSHTSQDTHVGGLTEVQEELRTIFEDEIENCKPSQKMTSTMGFISMVIWVLLAWGPVHAIYSEYYSAWMSTNIGSTGSGWTMFPTPSFGMVFTSMVLVFAPVFIIALCTLGFSVTRKRVNGCSDEIWKRTSEFIKQAIDNKIIRLKSDDEMRIAVRTLLDNCYDDSSAIAKNT